MTALVSIVIPTFNRQAFLAESIESYRHQTYENLEIIVVDDCSTDASHYLFDYYQKLDPRIKVIRLKKNQGISNARQTGCLAAKGEYIAVGDSDDLAAPDRIELSLQELGAADFVFSPYYQADEHGNVLGVVNPPAKLKVRDLDQVLEGAWPHVTIFAKRQCFLDHGYNPELKVNDDAYLCLNWFKAGYVGKRLNQPTMIVRYHPSSVSKTRDKEVKAITKQLKKELHAYVKSHATA